MSRVRSVMSAPTRAIDIRRCTCGHGYVMHVEAYPREARGRPGARDYGCMACDALERKRRCRRYEEAV